MWIYRLLLALLMPYLMARFALRVLTGQESWADMAERLGRLPSAPQSAQTLWLHAASNGELTSAKPLITHLLSSNPKLELLITCNSVTGRTLVQGWNLLRITVQLAPVDFRRNAQALIDLWSPGALVIIENELWPNRLAACHRSNVPVALIGARLSARSTRIWRLLAAARDAISPVALLSAQNKVSEQRFLSLGVSPCITAPRLNLKALYQFDPAALAPLKYPREHMLLAASTHSGEDRAILQAYQRARESWPQLRLILAPRHPGRATEVTALIKDMGLSCALRSDDQTPNGQMDVFLADTLGEMNQWYHASVLCFVGGSFVKVGGHTPYEPIGHDCVVLHGPHVRNFTEVYRDLAEIRGAISIPASKDLCNAILDLKRASTRRDLTRNAGTLLLDPKQIEDIGGRLQRWL